MSRNLVILVLIVLFASSCAPQSLMIPAIVTPAPAADLANPASVYCKEQGFHLELRTGATGSQSGICHFPDGSECDEWAYFRGECGPGSQAAAGATPTPSPTPVQQPATASAGTATFVSAALGVSFRYQPEQNGQAIEVLEQDDRIYIYPASMEPVAGQWVQVFHKPAGESLMAAITRVIMPGYPAQDCQVVPVGCSTGTGDYACDYEYARIMVRREPGEDDAAVLPRWRTCPQPYTVVGGIGYFQADPLHPDKFLFLSIGQYTILAGNDQSWQETIHFE